MSLDPHKAVLIAYEAMGFCNPLPASLLDRALAPAGLRPGRRVLDLGCGNAAMSIHLAEAYGVAVDALERSPAVAAIARKRLEGRAAPGSVRLHQAASRDFLTGEGAYDLLVAAGASGVVEGTPEPQAVLAALRPDVRPGGFILWADPYWRREPDPMFAAMLGPLAAYKSHAGNIEAAEAVGLETWFAGSSTEQDWDDYTWAMTAAAQAWLRDHPDDPDAEGVRQRTAFLRAAYLGQGRDSLGFGVYLFRAP